jgi:hypothetical protein
MEWLRWLWNKLRDYWTPPLLGPETRVKWQVIVTAPDVSWASGFPVTVIDITSGSPVVLASGVTGPTGHFYYPPTGTVGVLYPYTTTPSFVAEVNGRGYFPESKSFDPPHTGSEGTGSQWHEFQLFTVNVEMTVDDGHKRILV